MKKILLSLLVVGVVGFTAVKATGAFFTDTKNSTDNKFTAGKLTITINEQNLETPFQGEVLATNWQPGEDKLVNFDVVNSGTVPLQLRGFAAGTWNVGGLDPTKVKVVKIERWNGASWQNIGVGPFTGYFYDTNDGTVTGTFFNINPTEKAQLRLTVELDSSADNTYQGAIFNSSLQIEARQATTPTTVWP